MEAHDKSDLSAYARTGDEAAFRRIVDRHVGQAYRAALRRTSDPGLAEEICQDAFALMARKAASLASHPFLLGWLLRTIALRSAHVLRTEANRSNRMKKLARSLEIETHSMEHALSHEAAGQVDDAIERLPEKDRQIILMRFFQQKSYRDIGTALSMSEDSCQKRGTRALDKLERILRTKGVTLSAGAIAAGLGIEASKAVPAAIADNVFAGALSSASALAPTTLTIHTIQAMTHGKQLLLVTGILLATAAIPLTLQWNENRRLEQDITQLHQQLHEFSSGKPADPSVEKSNQGKDPANESRPAPNTTPYEMAFAALTGENGNSRRNSLTTFLAVLDTMTVDNAAEIRKAFSDSSDMGNDQFLEWTLFWERFGEVGGGAAAEYLKDSHEEVWAKSAFESLMKTWAQSDRDAAFSWLKQNADSSVFEKAFLGFVEGAAYDDPGEATRLALEATENPEAAEIRKAGMKALAYATMRTSGLDGMRDWFENLPASDASNGARKLAYGHVYWRLRIADPAIAADFITAQEDKPWQSSYWIGQHGNHFTWKSPKEGLDWAFGLGNPAADSARPAVSGALVAALKNHPDFLHSWIDENPDTLPEIQRTIPVILKDLESPEALQAAEDLLR